MSKQSARLAALALLMFAASASPLTPNATSTQLDGPNPYSPVPPASATPSTANVTSIQFDGPEPYPPVPPRPSCMPAPCPLAL